MRNLAIVAMIFTALRAVPASAGVVVGAGASAPLYQSNPSKEKPSASPQATIDYQHQIVRCWDSTMSEYFGKAVALMEAYLNVYPNAMAERGEILAMGALLAEASRKPEFEKVGDHYVFRGGITLQREGGQPDGRFVLRLPLADAGNGVRHIRFFALERDANRKDITVAVFWHKAGKSDGTSLIDTFSYMTEQWPINLPQPSPEQLGSLLGRLGNGGTDGMSLLALLTADSQQTPATPAEAPPCATTTEVPAIDVKSIEDRDRQLDAAIKVNDGNIRAVNDNLQEFKEWLAKRGVTPENISAIVEFVNQQKTRIDSLEARMQAVEAWFAAQAATPAPAPAVQPTVLTYRVVFVRSSRTDTWQVSSMSEISEPIVCAAVYIKYRDDNGVVRTDQYVAPERHGQIIWDNERVGSNREIGISLRPVGNGVAWQSRSWAVLATTRIVVVPVH